MVVAVVAVAKVVPAGDEIVAVVVDIVMVLVVDI